MNNKKWTVEQLIDAVKECKSIKSVIKKIGVSNHYFNIIKNEIENLNLDVSHFTKNRWNIAPSKIQEAISNSTSYPQVLEKLGINGNNQDNFKILKEKIKELDLSAFHLTTRVYNKAGTGYINDKGYHRIGNKLVHRLIMEQILGRPLLKNETVHHKNGNRTDNRPENLELWVMWQPRGQRVEDQVEWAVEILRKYNPNLLNVDSLDLLQLQKQELEIKIELVKKSRKLNLEQVASLRIDRERGATKKELAVKYNISQTAVHSILHNKTYKDK